MKHTTAFLACLILFCFVVGFATAVTDPTAPIIIGTTPPIAPNAGGDPNPNAVYFEKRISPDVVAYVIPDPVPELQYVEKWQDRPVYTLEQNPCGILGNRAITPTGTTQPTVKFEVVTPYPVSDYVNAKNWYTRSSTWMQTYVTGISPVNVTYYIEVTPAPGDSVVAIGFDPRDGTSSKVSGIGGSVSGDGKHSSSVTTTVGGVPIEFAVDDKGVARAYISHQFQNAATEGWVNFRPSVEVTTTNGCRAYVYPPYINKVWSQDETNAPVSNTATIHINSDVAGVNVWLDPSAPNFNVAAFGLDPLLGGYLGETPLDITIPVTEQTGFKVWAREFGYNDETSPVITIQPGGEYTITFDMDERESNGCYLARGYVFVVDSETGEPITNIVLSERIPTHPSLRDWYPCVNNGAEFYCEYYDNTGVNTYTVELRVTAPGYQDYYTSVELEALTQEVVRVNMTKGVTPTLVTTPEPTSTPFVVGFVGDATTNEQVANFVFEKTNAERTRLGFPELVWDTTLADMARYHSNDQITAGYMGHESPSGETITDRMRLFGLTGTVGENIHLLTGTHTPDETSTRAIVSLMRSPTHRDHILSESFTKIGVGVATNATTTITTQEFK